MLRSVAHADSEGYVDLWYSAVARKQCKSVIHASATLAMVLMSSDPYLRKNFMSNTNWTFFHCYCPFPLRVPKTGKENMKGLGSEGAQCS